MKSAAEGKTPEGKPINGSYKFTDVFPMSDGFQENAAYFKLDFLDPAEHGGCGNAVACRGLIDREMSAALTHPPDAVDRFRGGQLESDGGGSRCIELIVAHDDLHLGVGIRKGAEGVAVRRGREGVPLEGVGVDPDLAAGWGSEIVRNERPNRDP